MVFCGKNNSISDIKCIMDSNCDCLFLVSRHYLRIDGMVYSYFSSCVITTDHDGISINL